MKSVFTEKKTVAWFTLAECVSRGERERAFGVYRLLSHSLDDRALAAQLEGDLLCAFNMPIEALATYDKALKHYKQTGKLLEAAAVCGHMRLLDPDNTAYMQQALELYSALQFEERTAELLVELVTRYIERGLYDAACGAAGIIHELQGYGKQGFCYEQLLAALMRMENVPVHVRILYAQKTVAAYMHHGATAQLKQVLAQLSARDEEAYAAALKILKE